MDDALPWQQDRDSFNHRWMTSFLLTMGGAAVDLSQPQGTVRKSWEEFRINRLPEWPCQFKKAQSLLVRFESEMSPRQLLSRSPLFCIPHAQRTWIGNLIHALWISREDTFILVRNANRALAEANIAYEALERQLSNKAGFKEIGLLDVFRVKCQALSDSIHAFPRKIEVT